MRGVRWCCILAPAVLWSQTTSGTAGVAIWTPQRAVLAIDSRISQTDGYSSHRAPDECKIRSAGPYWIAVAGIYDHTPTKFDAWSLALEAAADSATVQQAVAAIENRVLPELQTAIRNIRALDLKGFAGYYGRTHLTIAIAGPGPAIAAVEFRPDRDGNVRVNRWGGEPGMITLLTLGEHAAIDKAYLPGQAFATAMRSPGPVEAARHMVQLEIASEPAIVGPPISVLEITPDGARWMYPGLCGK